MPFYGRVTMGRYGALPGFDTSSDPVYEGALAAKISAAQATSQAAVPYMTNPVVKGAVDGLEQAIGTALNDLRAAVGRVKSVNVNQGPTGSEADKPRLERFNYSGGGGQFQAALDIWRKQPGNDFYRPDIEDYRYPGGDGQYDAAMVAWGDAARRAAGAARDNLSSLLDQYNSKVPAAYKADLEQQAAEQEAHTSTTRQGTVKTQTETFIARQQLKVATDNAHAAAEAVAKPGMSPLVIAALVGVPVLGVIAYALSRKKSSVAGYRRRRSRR